MTAMIVNVFFDAVAKDADVVFVPFDDGQALEDSVLEFYKWMFDKSNNHSYWVREEGKEPYCSYRGDALVFWLNNYYLDDSVEESRLIEQWAEIIDCSNFSITM